jgi:hypothetical protein
MHTESIWVNTMEIGKYLREIPVNWIEPVQDRVQLLSY